MGKYPIDNLGSARSVISRVQAYGTAAEKKAVYSAIRSRYPSLAATSTVIPTRGGSGRHYGQPVGSRNRSR